MNINIISPYAEGVFDLDLTEIINNDALIEAMNQQRNKDQKGIVRSNAGGWQADIIEQNDEIDKLIYHLGLAATDIFKDIYGFHNCKNIKVSNMWWNTNNHGDQNVYHTHPGGIFSGVYYVQTNGTADQGQIDFSRYDNYLWECIKTSVVKDENREHEPSQFSSTSYCMTGQTGHAFLFPAHYNHRVTENLTDDERIVIGMNFTTV